LHRLDHRRIGHLDATKLALAGRKHQHLLHETTAGT
jgi:hypothetical protein